MSGVTIPAVAGTLQQRLALAGLLLAAVMVALFYQVLADNMAAIQNRRLADEQLARERHGCAMMNTRLERDQCLASVAPAAATEPQRQLRTLVAGR